mmetsp:Transcript_1892/g.3212  ORF Transcript_1892/g.3212 Transcript_1892/m.3212 type:complete len:205 (+) Transcript_1892:583-1197(+)
MKHGQHIRQILLGIRPNLRSHPQRAWISMRLPLLQHDGVFFHLQSPLPAMDLPHLLFLCLPHDCTNRPFCWRGNILVIHNRLPNARNALGSDRIYAIHLSQIVGDVCGDNGSHEVVSQLFVGKHEELSAIGILFHPVGNEIFVVRELIGEAVGWRVAVIYPGFVGAAGRVGGEMVLVFILQIKIARHSIDRIPQNYHSPTKKRV